MNWVLASLNCRRCCSPLRQLILMFGLVSGQAVWAQTPLWRHQVEVPGDQSINGLFEALSRNGIEVISMRNKQNRLEQLFVDMVGRKEAAEAGAA